MNTAEFISKLGANGKPRQQGDGWMACCPAHVDKTPSLSVSTGNDGRVMLHCFAGCSIDAVVAAANITTADLFNGEPKRNGKTNVQRREVAAYDYTDEAGTLLFQVVRYDPKDFRQRQPDGNGGWNWKLAGVRRVLFGLPKLIEGISAGFPVFICEGEKDCLALQRHGLTATCNAGGAESKADGSKWLQEYTERLRGADVCIIADRDAPGRNHGQVVAHHLHDVAKSIRVIELPDVGGRTVKDAADYIAAGGAAGDVLTLASEAPLWQPTVQTEAGLDANGHPFTELPEVKPRSLTLRSPDELLAMQFDDSDIILGDRLFAKGQSLVIAAQGGIGKSRLLLQMAASVATGRQFLTFNTSGETLRWLVLQTENSNRRLQYDFGKLRAWLGDDWKKFNERVVVHTMENDADGFVSLDNLENVGAIADAIERSNPDIIAIDPLNDFAVGDLNKDADMRATVSALSRVCRKGNPERGIVALHHALTGKAGAAKAIGFDRSSFGRNSKTLHAWTRGQINLAPVNEDDNECLVVACGKCSNGREFLPFAVRLDPETMVFSPDPSVDVAQWAKTISGQSDKAPLASPERVRELCQPLSKKAELAKAIIDDCGCYRGSAYRYITRAEQARKIKFNKRDETYCPV